MGTSTGETLAQFERLKEIHEHGGMPRSIAESVPAEGSRDAKWSSAQVLGVIGSVVSIPAVENAAQTMFAPEDAAKASDAIKAIEERMRSGRQAGRFEYVFR